MGIVIGDMLINFLEVLILINQPLQTNFEYIDRLRFILTGTRKYNVTVKSKKIVIFAFYGRVYEKMLYLLRNL
jgi:hypothetical protein